MGINDLETLKLAGVVWELNEFPAKQKVKENINQQNSADVSKSFLFQEQKSAIVPPVAPITINTVKSMVNRPANLPSLLRMIAEFNHPLKSYATNVVLPSIASNPNGLLILSDVPKSEDDSSGRVLSGAAGEMIDKMLNAIGMSRENVSILPLIFWATPGGRSPTDEELNLARPFVDKIIEMLKPRVILTLGTLPAKEFAKVNLDTEHGMEKQTDDGYVIIPIYHPNYLMLKPSAKRDVWNVLQYVQNLLKNS